MKDVDAKFDPNAIKGDLTLGPNDTRIYLEGIPGSGSCTLLDSLNKKKNAVSFKVIWLCPGAVIAVGIKCLKKKIGKNLMFFSRQFFWRYKITGGEKWSAVLKKWEPYGVKMLVEDVVTLEVNFTEGEISFYCNGEHMGIAFWDQRLTKEDVLYPYVYLSKDSYQGRVEIEIV